MRQLVSETHAGVSGERAKGEERTGRSTRTPGCAASARCSDARQPRRRPRASQTIRRLGAMAAQSRRPQLQALPRALHLTMIERVSIW